MLAGYSNAANVATLTAATFPKAWSSSVHLIHFLERGAQGSAAIVEAVTGVAAAMKSSKIFKVGVVYCAKEGELCEGRTAAPLQVCALGRLPRTLRPSGRLCSAAQALQRRVTCSSTPDL